MRDIFRLIRNSVSALNQYMQEDLIGIEVVQLSGRQDVNALAYGALNKDNRHQEFRAINYEVVYDTFNNSLASVAMGAIVWYGGGQVVQNDISLGSMVLFTQLVSMMVMPIVALGQQFNILFRSMASGERIFQALDWEESLKEPAEPVDLPERLDGTVEFRHAHFGYYEDEPVLRDVSFKIDPGEKLAIVGPTGSGKSTIVRLLARFYEFDDGMIFLDDIDVNQISSRDLRTRVGVVLQDFHIFSGTVLDNITLNNPKVSEERARWAARVVNADRFIQELPDGYATELAERGQNLSQGQRQLLAFARVLAADPEILVLDEATASIDTATELIIQDALHKLTEGRSSIIIAHRLQTIQECDRVLVLHHGVVEEYGTHDELMARRGIYYTLHELQFQDSAVAAELMGGGAETEEPPVPRWTPPDTEDDPDHFPE
jgi:ATP-binding cassette subfamily B protein